MPNLQTPLRSGPLLGISLEKNSHIPGDTITGLVCRQTHTVSPDASVSVCMFGRVRTIGVMGNNSKEYQGQYNICYHSQTIYKGPLHIETSGHCKEWSFEISLPKYGDPSLDQSNKHPTYQPLDPSDHELPPTHTLRNTSHMAAVIEYVIKARLTLTSHGEIEVFEAVLPFKVINSTPDPPIVDFQVIRRRNDCAISSQRLVPGMRDVKLSLKDKIKQSFSASKDPELGFDLFIEAPMTIQLDNPTPIPFRLCVSPNWDKTSDAIRDMPQEVNVSSIQICIVTTTTILCHGRLEVKESTEIDLGVNEAISQLKKNIQIPFSTEWQFIDVGEAINLRIGLQNTGFPRQWTFRQTEFTHSFMRYNVRVSHRLKWSVKGDIVGERFEASGASDLLILKPSDGREHVQRAEETVVTENRVLLHRNASWIVPPPEEAPPSFTVAQKEN
ncbi:hypothetical protein FBEOM_13727 [Fusarium beomiforme]|uniref:Arrestin-like N-terminal domain-containing protein n=1 Tax=Fusarium beomiforme TaxID=44412 RepID=A0A9P5A599_9HYPO|nr:hypothetical protein FBEOM_13727 [Fusarium beomiforme]